MYYKDGKPYKPSRHSTEKPDHIMVSINGDAKTQMAVTWRTSLDIDEGYVEYYEENSEEIITVKADTWQFESDMDTSNIHSAMLKNLKSGRKYYYTCGNGEFRSGEYYFETEKENLDKFTFLAISDQQQDFPHECPDYSFVNKLLKRVLGEHPEIKFIISAGDNSNCGQHEIQWNGAFSALEGIAESIPVMMTLGNHDNRGFDDYFEENKRYYAEPAVFFNTQLKGAYPSNGPKNWITENYSFDYGNAHFCIMGVNGPEEVGEWLIDDIGQSKKTWKIGSYHFPMYYSNPSGQNNDAFPWMREGMELCDLILSGHEHNFSRSFPIKNDAMFDRPSEGTIHYMLGNAGRSMPGCNPQQMHFHTAFYPQEEPLAMYTLFEIDKNKMTVTAILEDGRIVDKCIIDKDSDTVFPYSVAPIYKENEPRMVYKGAILGLAAKHISPVKRDGIWYAPLALLFQSIGGEVHKEAGRVTLSIYGKTAAFYQGSNEAVCGNGDKVTLDGNVFRGQRGELFIPAFSASEIFGFRCVYVERNHFMFWEHESEDVPVYVQP